MKLDGSLQPNWKGMNIESFLFNFGSEIKIGEIRGIILDFSEDEGGKWYGICFIHAGRLFGRRIPVGFSRKTMDLFDLTFFHESLMDDVKLLSEMSIELSKVKIGEINMAVNIERIHTVYEEGVKQRKKIETTGYKKLWKFDAINECYFDLDKIKF